MNCHYSQLKFGHGCDSQPDQPPHFHKIDKMLCSNLTKNVLVYDLVIAYRNVMQAGNIFIGALHKTFE